MRESAGVRRALASWTSLRAAAVALYGAAAARGRLGGGAGRGSVRRVVHVSPAFFGGGSIVGGGERYAVSLAQAMAGLVDTVFLSFGPERRSERHGELQVEIFPILELKDGVPFDPVSFSFLPMLRGFDVVHCHQYRTIVTNFAALAAAALGKRVFVTDLGGTGRHFTHVLPVARTVTGFLPISEFGARVLPDGQQGTVIHGGVDDRFLAVPPAAGPKPPRVLFVGRLLPHKGIDDLVRAMEPGWELVVMGRPYSPEYFALLQELAAGKSVRFVTDASDEDLVRAYQEAAVTVLPSVYRDTYGVHHEIPELLGLVLLESMACGTPAICTDVGGMPEFVDEGVTGFVVPPNSPEALRDRIAYLLNDPMEAAAMGQRGRESVARRFTWRAVAERCLRAYGG